jgi:hypothetical protein
MDPSWSTTNYTCNGSLSIDSIIFVLDIIVSKVIEFSGKLIVPIENNYGLVTNITFSSSSVMPFWKS